MAIIVPSQATPIPEASVVTLARYAQIIHADECAVWGVRYEGQERLDCGTIWSKTMRDTVIKYLAQAQQLIEQELRYPLMPRWIVGEFNAADPTAIFSDAQAYSSVKLQGAWGKFIEAGIKATEEVETASVTYSGTTAEDTGSISILTDIDTSELFVYHPNTQIEVTPSAVTSLGGIVTFTFPRCRLVLPEYADNPSSGYQVINPEYFATELTITRVYTDPSVQGVLKGGTQCNCGTAGCTNTSFSACIRAENAPLSLFSVYPARYVNGVWTRSSALCGRRYDIAHLNYKAGLKVLPYVLEDAIVRLAHALMPDEPCGCEWGQRMWKRDREVPEILTAPRLSCPFGVSEGAWMAWRVAVRQRLFTPFIL